MTLRRATERLREVGSLPLLLTALLLAASGDLSAQDRSRARSNDSGSSGRHAEPRSSDRSPAPSAPPTPPRSASPSSPSSSDSPSASPSSPSRRRYAVPGSPGDARRQPPSRDRNDPNAHRGGRGGRGGYHHPYYYPYGYGSRYYGGPGWWWAPYGYWGWFWWGHDYYYDDYYYGDPYSRGRRYSGEREIGALDLDVSPGRTQVWLDGQYIGTVDQYDGFPTYLWLEKGTYDIAFYLDGYRTVARQVSVYPGTVIDFDDRLEPGEATKPEDLVSKSHERRDERIRFERERRERIERGEEEVEEEVEEDEGWRDRVRREREDRRDRGEGIEIEIPDDRDGRSEQGRVRLEVEPDDASIYLDGKFVGTARDLASLRRGLLVEPGEHTVAVVRPGRESVEREFEVEAGEELELEIELEPAGR